MSMKAPYIKGTSEKILRLVRSYKIRSTFYAENILRKLFYKIKERVTIEDKINIVSEIECSSCKRILITLTKFHTCFLKYGFLIYGSFKLVIYFTPVDSN